MQHVVRAVIVVVGDIDKAAVGGIDSQSDIAAGALQTKEATKIEFGIQSDAHSGFVIRGIHQIGERLWPTAAAVIAQDYDVRRALPCLVVERSP